MDNTKDVLDMLLYNMAKAYTDKVVEVAKPKVIDFDKYGISEVIQGLSTQGGGTEVMENMGQFWSDVSTERELRIEMTFANYRLVIDQCSCAKWNGRPVQIAYTLTMVYGELTMVSVAITGSAEETNIFVKVS